MDTDCRHEIKRHLLLGRKAMRRLDGVLKSKDIPLLKKVYIVKNMVFLVVMYGCYTEELMLLNCGAGEPLGSPLTCKEIKPVNPKRNQPGI